MDSRKIHEVVAIIDRSGSMAGKEDDTIGGINSAFEELSNDQDENTTIKVSVKLFDHEEKMLFRSIELKDVKPITRSQYTVRGQTALLDAIGNTLNYFMEKKLTNSSAYNACTIYIATDGLENTSKHYNSSQIKSMIKEADESFNIKILYMGANQDAILEANKYGIPADQAINYSETSENVDAVYRSAASAARRHASGNNVAFTMPERSASQAPPTTYGISPPSSQRSRSHHNTSPPRVSRQRTTVARMNM
jgi:uncharacterized protein YegL